MVIVEVNTYASILQIIIQNQRITMLKTRPRLNFDSIVVLIIFLFKQLMDSGHLGLNGQVVVSPAAVGK